MKWFVIVFLIVLVVCGVIAALLRTLSEARSAGRAWFGRRSAGRMTSPAERCLRCHGTGWLNREPERTLNFVGDAFEDRHQQGAMCPACGGTGVLSAR